MKVSGYDLRHVAILQLLHFVLFVHLDVPLILCDHMKTCSYLIDDCLGNCFEVFNTSSSVMGWQMEEKIDKLRSFSLHEMSFGIVVFVSLRTHEHVVHVLLLTQPLLTSLASRQSTLAYDKSAYFFLKALISYRRGKLVAFLFCFSLL